jgi:hypothetical protein
VSVEEAQSREVNAFVIAMPAPAQVELQRNIRRVMLMWFGLLTWFFLLMKHPLV